MQEDNCSVCGYIAHLKEDVVNDPRFFCSFACQLIQGTWDGIYFPDEVMEKMMSKMGVIELSELAYANSDALRVLKNGYFWREYRNRSNFTEEFLVSISNPKVTVKQLIRLFDSKLFNFMRDLSYSSLFLACIDSGNTKYRRVCHTLLQYSFLTKSDVSFYVDSKKSVQILPPQDLAKLCSLKDSKNFVSDCESRLFEIFPDSFMQNEFYSILDRKFFRAGMQFPTKALFALVETNNTEMVSYLLFRDQKFPLFMSVILTRYFAQLVFKCIQTNKYHMLHDLLKFNATFLVDEAFYTQRNASIIHAARKDYDEIIFILNRYLDQNYLWRLIEDYAGSKIQAWKKRSRNAVTLKRQKN